MSDHELFMKLPDGSARPATKQEILRAAQRALAHRMRRGASISSPQQVREYLSVRFGGLDHEVFSVIFVDRRNRILDYVELFRGTLDGAGVHPREVVKMCLEKAAAAVILVHNHPSCDVQESGADILITQRLRDALGLIDVRVLDHLIIGGDAVASFAERGLL